MAIGDERGMAEALAVAAAGLDVGELPVGAVVVAGGLVVGRAHTQERGQRRLLVHAELLALDEADRTPGWDRSTATLFTTVEPCLMCLGAAATAMVGRIVFALAADSDGAARLAAEWSERRAEGLSHVRVPTVVGGVGRSEAVALFERFVGARAPDDPLARWASSLLPRR
ncbi:MAG TPA: deaminase [Acidimicrobiales bacterium]|nr:deaminase [Acidimicrobiales bacterium]